MPVINPKTSHPFRSSNGPLLIWSGIRHHHRHPRIIQSANGLDDLRMVAQQISRSQIPGLKLPDKHSAGPDQCQHRGSQYAIAMTLQIG
jgi:hypothetical protein